MFIVPKSVTVIQSTDMFSIFRIFLIQIEILENNESLKKGLWNSALNRILK